MDGGLSFLKRGQWGETALRPEARPGEGEGGGATLACAFCMRAVTTTAARIEVGGSHEHTFSNPHGFVYRIGCFGRVSGCRTVGPPSTFWSWFAGYAWQIEQCGGCREHLGWLFTSGDGAFHGLILDRLVEVEGGE